MLCIKFFRNISLLIHVFALSLSLSNETKTYTSLSLREKLNISLYGGLESNKGRQYRERKLKGMEEEEEKPKWESSLSFSLLRFLNGDQRVLARVKWERTTFEDTIPQCLVRF